MPFVCQREEKKFEAFENGCLITVDFFLANFCPAEIVKSRQGNNESSVTSAPGGGGKIDLCKEVQPSVDGGGFRLLDLVVISKHG